MNDFSIFIPFVNREDLLQKAIESVAVYGKARTIIDNSPQGLPLDDWNHWNGVYVKRPPVPLSCPQTFNWIMRMTRDAEQKICMWMHSDAEAGAGVAEGFLEFVRGLDGRRWGVVFTHYDTLSAINPELLDVVGEWDTFFWQYYCDSDYHHRVRMAGWEIIDSPFTDIKHYGSATINNDPEFLFWNNMTYPFYREYYKAKWNGDSGHETFTRPFNR